MALSKMGRSPQEVQIIKHYFADNSAATAYPLVISIKYQSGQSQSLSLTNKEALELAEFIKSYIPQTTT